jgi:hypothetical protein
VADPCRAYAEDDGGVPLPSAANVRLLLVNECAGCHTPGGNALVFEASKSPADLVGAPSPTEPCGGTLVVSGDPGMSYLYAKMSQPHPCAGAQMPVTEFGTGGALPLCAQELVRRWIATSR